MTDPDDVRELADLNVATVRRENDHVDDRMSELESKASELEQQVATLEDEKADLAEEKEATEKLLASFRDNQREEQLSRIKQANEAVDADEEIDLSTLEDANVDQLETVADMLEAAAGSAGVSNRDRSPDLTQVEASNEADLTDQMTEVAAENGLLGKWQEINGESEQASSDPTVKDMLEAYEQNNGTMGGDF